MKLVFDVENKRVELQNENNVVVDSWKVETETDKTFFFTKNSIVDYIAAYITFSEVSNIFFCNGVRRKTGETYELCTDREFVKFFMINAPIINDYKIMLDKGEVNQ